ncbi:MAG: DUF3784 domain-containing protein [Ruminococcaceae bacterium]|nr:DUF3784 domain-containing protein [Oscillospiraceae bacterium]
MLAVKIIVLLLGVLFTLFGYLIYFRKKYSLINGFESAHRSERKTERYAGRIGLIELMIGVACLIGGIIWIIINGL